MRRFDWDFVTELKYFDGGLTREMLKFSCWGWMLQA